MLTTYIYQEKIEGYFEKVSGINFLWRFKNNIEILLNINIKLSFKYIE